MNKKGLNKIISVLEKHGVDYSLLTVECEYKGNTINGNAIEIGTHYFIAYRGMVIVKRANDAYFGYTLKNQNMALCYIFGYNNVLPNNYITVDLEEESGKILGYTNHTVEEEEETEELTTETKELISEVFEPLKTIIDQRSTQYGFQSHSKSQTVVIASDENQYELGAEICTVNVNGIDTQCITLYHHDHLIQDEITVNLNDFSQIYFCENFYSGYPLTDEEVRNLLKLAQYRMQFLDELKTEELEIQSVDIENTLVHLDMIADVTKNRTKNSWVYYIENLKFSIKYEVVEGDETLKMGAFKKSENGVYCPIWKKINYMSMIDLVEKINELCIEHLDNCKELDRLKMVKFLQWNDPNGSYEDWSMISMDALPMSYEDARHSTMVLFNIDYVLEKFMNEFECNAHELEKIMNEFGTKEDTHKRLEKLLDNPFYSYNLYRTL